MGESNVFEHPAESAKLNANFPYLTHIISEIKCLKDGPFLPSEVSKVFLSMISLLEDFNAFSYNNPNLLTLVTLHNGIFDEY